MTSKPTDIDVCRAISRRHGVSYYWAARLLRPDQRDHVYALYAFCRTADDIVDAAPDAAPNDDATFQEPLHDSDTGRRRAELARFRARFDAARAGRSDPDPVLTAVTRTVDEYGLPSALFDRFFAAMGADLDTTGYDTWHDLLGYMDGSAAVIGEMMLPILEPVDADAALGPARSLGLAFQLTNFLRDIGADLDLGRQYLPRADLERFGVELAERRVDGRFHDLMRFEIARCRTLYADARVGLGVLPPRSRRCIGAAANIYEAILDEIESNAFDVFSRRATVSNLRKARLVAREFVGS